MRVQHLGVLDGPVVLDVPRSDVALNDYVSLAHLPRRHTRGYMVEVVHSV